MANVFVYVTCLAPIDKLKQKSNAQWHCFDNLLPYRLYHFTAKITLQYGGQDDAVFGLVIF